MVKKDKWSALSMQDKAALIDIYVKSGITDLGEIRKDYNGIPYRDFNTSEYDYFNAHPSNAPTKEGEHWTSRNPRTGQLLKREDHPTFDLMIEGEKQAGYNVVKGLDGNLYSIPNTTNNYVEDYNSFGDGGDTEEPIYMGELEPAVVKPKPVTGVLNTYYPFVSEYPYTGHSELQLVGFGWEKPITISKYGSDYDYNLVTNNCSDATKCAVEQIFGDKINPLLFTTPGDVQDFISEKLGVEPFKEDVGKTSMAFDVPFATAMDLKNQTIDFYIQDYLHKANEFKKKQQKENPKWNSSGFDESTKKVIENYENQKYKFQPFINEYGGKLNKFDTGGPKGEGLATYNHPKYNHAEEKNIYTYLRSRGIPHTQASAIMGNIAVESMLDPYISQIGGGGGYGLIQATDQPRKNNFINYDGQPYEFGSKLDPETQRQLDYIIDKGLNTYTIGEWRKVGKSGARNVRKEFLKETDVIKASDLFTKGYLRPGKPHTKRRQSMSSFYNEKYTNPFENDYNDAFLFK